jgi:hypothetical protein
LFERFNGPARRALQLAFREARRRQHDFLGTEHLLFGLLCDHSSSAGAVLRGLTQPSETLQARLEELLHDEPTGAALEQFPLSPAAQRALRFAAEEAAQLGRTVVGPEHLLLALLREPETQAALILSQAGLQLDDARRAARELPASEKQEFLLQATNRPPSGGPDPTAEELLALIGPTVPPAPSQIAEPAAARAAQVPDIVAPALQETTRQAAEIENQLRKTQLVLGAAFGFYLGQAAAGWQLGVLAALAGVCLALLRSSFAGAWMGFIAGSMLMTGQAHEVDDRFSIRGRLVLGVIGALLGSFLGDFWRSKPRVDLPRDQAEGHD